MSGRAAATLLLLVSTGALAEEVPIELGVTVLLKVVTYDQSFANRGSGDFTVLVPFEKDKGRADSVLKELASVAKSKIRARQLVFEVVSGGELSAAVEAKKASAILATSDLPDALLAEVARLGKASQLYTLGLGERTTKSSVAVGVVPNKDGKPQIVVNVAQARATGMDLPQSLLKVARLVQ